MITIYSRKDLVEKAEKKTIDKIEYQDFRNNTDPFRKADLVLFIEGSQCKILKSRYSLDVNDLLVSFQPFVPKMIQDFTGE